MSELKHHPGFWLRDDAAEAFNAAEDDHGTFSLTSAGRTEAEQQRLINRWFAGGVYNRPPYLYEPARPASTSAHVADGGIAVDVTDWQRFAASAADYGFDKPHDWDVVHFEFRGRPARPANTTTGGDDLMKIIRNTKDGGVYIVGPKRLKHLGTMKDVHQAERTFGRTIDLDDNAFRIALIGFNVPYDRARKGGEYQG